MKSKFYVTTALAITVIVAATSWVSTWAQEARETVPADRSKAGADDPAFVFPRLKDHGKVVRLPHAVDQPRNGSKICVDITAGGSAEKLNPAIEKVARFVNVYAGAGVQPAEAHITVVLHGDATLTTLSDQAYAAKFPASKNPNLGLLKQLHDAGVELLVCGQALRHKGADPDDLADVVNVAVSALTVNVNRQMDGYAYIPLH